MDNIVNREGGFNRPLVKPNSGFIREFLNHYQIESVQDINMALKDILTHSIETIVNDEMDEHLTQVNCDVNSNVRNSRNGKKDRTLKTNYGDITIEFPQDRNSTFQSNLIQKYQRDISDMDNTIIKLYSAGNSVATIADIVRDVYGTNISEGQISVITNKVFEDFDVWRNRPLSSVYAIVFIDAIHFSVRDTDNVVRKMAAYIILGYDQNGKKEILSVAIGQAESSKFWLLELNKLKSRGVKDILILSSDGLAGLKESVMAAFPECEHQQCIIHIIRNTLKYVSYKNMKEFAMDLKTIYHAPDVETAERNRDEVKAKWDLIYPGAMDRWVRDWNVITPLFNFSSAVRKVIYTTNAIESVNSSFRRVNKNRGSFPTKESLEKSLFLEAKKFEKKWVMPIRNWGQIHSELNIIYDNRLDNDNF